MQGPSLLADSSLLSSRVVASPTTALLCSRTVVISRGGDAGLSCLHSHVLRLPSAPPLTMPTASSAVTAVTPLRCAPAWRNSSRPLCGVTARREPSSTPRTTEPPSGVTDRARQEAPREACETCWWPSVARFHMRAASEPQVTRTPSRDLFNLTLRFLFTYVQQ